MFKPRSFSSIRAYLSLTGRKKTTTRKPLRVHLNDIKVRNIFQEPLEESVNHVSGIHSEVAWDNIRVAVEIAVMSTRSRKVKKKLSKFQ